MCTSRDKFLIIGGSGLLGSRLHEMIAGDNVFVTYHSNPIGAKNSFQLDITNKSQVEKVFREVSPRVVINVAAFTNVDGCESQKERARMVNAEGGRNTAIEAKKYGAKLVYISTDYVFDGQKGMYKESDVTNPINHYGLTKLQGEQAVMGLCDNFIVARTSVLYGRGRKNFTTWIIDELKNRKELTIVTDQFVSPTLNTDLSHQILALIEADATGIYHTAGAERISRFDFAQKVAEEFDLDSGLIVPYASECMNWVAKRPMDSSLDISKVSRVRKPLKVHEAIKTLRGEMS